MRTPIRNKTPREWLSDTGADPGQIADILASFDRAASPRLFTYTAPHIFLRFHGPRSRRGIYQPNYWADGSALSTAHGRAEQFEGFLSDDEISNIAKTYYRKITAICHNWNPLESPFICTPVNW